MHERSPIMKQCTYIDRFKTDYPCFSPLKGFSECITGKANALFVLKDTYAMVSLFIILFALVLCINCWSVILVNLYIIISVIIKATYFMPKRILLC